MEDCPFSETQGILARAPGYALFNRAWTLCNLLQYSSGRKSTPKSRYNRGYNPLEVNSTQHGDGNLGRQLIHNYPVNHCMLYTLDTCIDNLPKTLLYEVWGGELGFLDVCIVDSLTTSERHMSLIYIYIYNIYIYTHKTNTVYMCTHVDASSSKVHKPTFQFGSENYHLSFNTYPEKNKKKQFPIVESRIVSATPNFKTCVRSCPKHILSYRKSSKINNFACGLFTSSRVPFPVTHLHWKCWSSLRYFAQQLSWTRKHLRHTKIAAWHLAKWNENPWKMNGWNLQIIHLL